LDLLSDEFPALRRREAAPGDVEHPNVSAFLTLGEAGADDYRVVGQRPPFGFQLAIGRETMVTVQHYAVLVEFDGYEHPSSQDVRLEQLILLLVERREQLIGACCGWRTWLGGASTRPAASSHE
jgi:hypothetical protein